RRHAHGTKQVMDLPGGANKLFSKCLTCSAGPPVRGRVLLSAGRPAVEGLRSKPPDEVSAERVAARRFTAVRRGRGPGHDVVRAAEPELRQVRLDEVGARVHGVNPATRSSYDVRTMPL